MYTTLFLAIPLTLPLWKSEMKPSNIWRKLFLHEEQGHELKKTCHLPNDMLALPNKAKPHGISGGFHLPRNSRDKWSVRVAACLASIWLHMVTRVLAMVTCHYALSVLPIRCVWNLSKAYFDSRKVLPIQPPSSISLQKQMEGGWQLPTKSSTGQKVI